MLYAYCTAGIAACSASDLVPSRPRSTETDTLLLAQLPPRRKFARPIAYLSELGDEKTGAKAAGEMNVRSVIEVPPHSWW
jgi:hypothetical protein